MQFVTEQISNIVFDLGEVIIDLDIPGTIQKFAAQSGKTVEEIRKIYTSSDVFLNYEKGLISDEEFRSGANRLFGTSYSDDEFDGVWNGMLRQLPAKRLQLLKKLSGQYRIFLLSNTNAIHLRQFTKMVQDVSAAMSMEDYFEKAYYSHLVKMRKPDAEIFEHVLKESSLEAAQTLFLDDNEDNIIGARACGIQAERILQPDQLFEIFR